MKKIVMLMAGVLAVALAGSAQAATMFAVQDGTTDTFIVDQTGSFSTPGSFIWDNTNKRLGIGTDAPAGALHLNFKTALPALALERELNSTGASSMQSDNYSGAGGGAASGAGLLLRLAKGTKAVPAAVAAGDRLGFVVFGGIPDATVNNFKHTGAINAFVDAGTVSNTSLPTYLQFQTTADGSTARTERLRITADGRLRITNQPAAPSNGSACTASGDLILDAAGGFLYLCNGSTWKRATFQ